MKTNNNSLLERYRIGDKIQIKNFSELNEEDKRNVTAGGNSGKRIYLGQILTIVEIEHEHGFRDYCTVKEDNEAFCWFRSFIAEKPLLPAMKTKELPIL